MGTSAVAVGSSFATTLHTFRCIHSKQLWPSDPLLRLASNRMLQVASISNSHPIEQFPAFPIPFFRKWRIPRIAAAVAQEEAAVDEEEKGEGEGSKGREEISGGESEEGGLNTKIYFGNLPYHCDSAQLAGIIQQYGNPELVEVLYDRDTGRSRGFGFVTMSNIEDAKLVINNLDGIEYGGRTLRVNFSDRPRPKEPLYPETEYKLFVGNLSWSVTSESLIQVFQEYGTRRACNAR